MNGQQDEHGTSSQQSSHVEIVSRSGKELVVEISGEASHCLDRVGENHPGVLLDWNPRKVCAAVEVANRDRPPLPPWMPDDSYPITVEGLQRALIRHIGAAGSNNIVGNILIAPNSLVQYTHIVCRLSQLMVADAFISHICKRASCRPLAAFYVFADRKRKKTAVAMPILPLPIVFGAVPAFE